MTTSPSERNRETQYLEILLQPIRVCANYRPKFGQGVNSGFSLEGFLELYKSDPFYSGLGLDNPLMYAAHKAAGGMTSIYRQIGIGSERLFRIIVRDELELSDADVTWSYQVTAPSGRKRTLSLDARIPIDKVPSPEKKQRVRDWVNEAAHQVGGDGSALDGVVFEVRQGYKSKDSKRQNADIANASKAYEINHLPCVAVFSGQIDIDIINRYRAERWCVITGAGNPWDPLSNIYTFMREVVGYDLAAFLDRNRDTLRNELDAVLRGLLSSGN